MQIVMEFAKLISIYELFVARPCDRLLLSTMIQNILKVYSSQKLKIVVSKKGAKEILLDTLHFCMKN